MPFVSKTLTNTLTPGTRCIRLNSDDLTNGFFVAAFQRKSAVNGIHETTHQKKDTTCTEKGIELKKRKTNKRKYSCTPVTAKI